MLTPDRIGTSAAMGATHGEPGRNGLANHTHNTLLEQFYATLNAMYLNAIEIRPEAATVGRWHAPELRIYSMTATGLGRTPIVLSYNLRKS